MPNKNGTKDGSQRGKKAGGRGRNKVSPADCRHPKTKSKRAKKK